MWSDNDIDNAFQRLNPPEPEPAPFPLDAWLRLETQLDEAAIERTVRHRLWMFFAAEVALVALVGLGWLLWPARPDTTHGAARTTARSTPQDASHAPAAAAAPTRGPGSTVAAVAAPAAVATASGPGTGATERADASPGSSVRVAHAPAGTEVPAALSRSSSKLAIGPTAAPAARRGRPADGPLGRPATATVVAVSSQPLHHPASRPAASRATETGRGPVSLAATGRGRRLSAAATATDGPPPAARLSGAAGFGAPITKGQPRPSARFAAPPPHDQPVDNRPEAPVSGQRAGGAVAAQPASSAQAEPLIRAETLAAGAFAGIDRRTVALATVAAPGLPARLATVAAPEAPRPAPLVPVVRQPRFYIGLVGAPDVTTVKFLSIESPLPNLGVTLEYRLTSRLRLTTGLLRSTKQYMARREDYDFGSRTPYLTHRYFKDVDGNCTVLDVPLNLRYDFISGAQHKVFGSLGLSSFFMQRETYSYAYTENYMPGYWQGTVVNENRHFLRIANLSVGYERSLGAHWCVQAEPYVKLPLGGVGMGKVWLTSAGVFLGVKYGL